jgi:DNA uptake protein ComE-like DNA-binding protein
LQAILYFDIFKTETPICNSKEKQDWLAFQEQYNLEKNNQTKDNYKLYPFNPNFITDYKGYSLGMSTDEIDRLHAFRKQNKFANSAEEFQHVTKISDSLLQKIQPYFKFPDWVNKKSNATFYSNNEKISVKLELNEATKTDFMKISGIGEALSDRILQQKIRLGAFVTTDQLSWIYGISPEVANKLKEAFQIKKKPLLTKLEINSATLKELADFPYFNYALAKDIITFRTMHGNEILQNDLTKIKNFPTDKVATIALYLQF